MSRGLLTELELTAIAERLPNVREFQARTLGPSPDLISINFPHDSTIPVAAVCFRDLGHTLCEVHHALHECFAHGLYYRKHHDPPKDLEATYFERFYLEDAALRLYSGGEHLANAIICMLEITDGDLKAHRHVRVSQQSIVAAYLRKEKADHPVTKAVLPLGSSPQWGQTIKYRNEWVHDQPPTVEGLGIVYRRANRRALAADGASVTIVGGGDEPEYTIEQLKRDVEGASAELLDASSLCFNHYVSILETYEISLSEDGTDMKIRAL